MNLRSSVETELVRQGFDLDTVSKWLGNSPDVARKHYLQITPDDIAKASAMGGKKKSADSPQQRGAKTAFPPVSGELKRGEKQKSTPGRSRTCNLRFRRPTLYPIELRVRLFSQPTRQQLPPSRPRIVLTQHVIVKSRLILECSQKDFAASWKLMPQSQFAGRQFCCKR